MKRPPGFPFNLNSAVDALLKKEFDHYRAENLPHPYMISAGINAIPYQNTQLDTWRSNFKGVSFVHQATNFETFGAVDDIWLDLDTKEMIVVDYKATSKADAVSLHDNRDSSDTTTETARPLPSTTTELVKPLSSSLTGTTTEHNVITPLPTVKTVKRIVGAKAKYEKHVS